MPSSSALIPMSICTLQCLFCHSFTTYELLNRDCDVCLFVCLFSRVPEGRMTAVSSRSHASCRVWARTHRSHNATRHAARGRQDQFLMMRYNTGLTAAPASPLYGSPVCKRSPIQVLTVLNMITIVYGSILRPSSNNWASYRRLKWQIAALFL
jgi:hypothetical protein